MRKLLLIVLGFLFFASCKKSKETRYFDIITNTTEQEYWGIYSSRECLMFREYYAKYNRDSTLMYCERLSADKECEDEEYDTKKKYKWRLKGDTIFINYYVGKLILVKEGVFISYHDDSKYYEIRIKENEKNARLNDIDIVLDFGINDSLSYKDKKMDVDKNWLYNVITNIKDDEYWSVISSDSPEDFFSFYVRFDENGKYQVYKSNRGVLDTKGVYAHLPHWYVSRDSFFKFEESIYNKVIFANENAFITYNFTTKEKRFFIKNAFSPYLDTLETAIGDGLDCLQKGVFERLSLIHI